MSDNFGTVEFTTHYDTTPPRITIDRADPHVLITDEILNEAAVCGRRDFHGSILRIEPPPGLTPFPWSVWHDHDDDIQCISPGRCFYNWLLHVDIPGRHLVYRIGKYRLETNRWEASWPD